MSRTQPERIARQEELAALDLREIFAKYKPIAEALREAVDLRLDLDPGAGSVHGIRTAVDLARAEFGGLSVLLVRKGIISPEEYFAAVVEGAETEVENVREAMGLAGHRVITLRKG